MQQLYFLIHTRRYPITYARLAPCHFNRVKIPLPKSDVRLHSLRQKIVLPSRATVAPWSKVNPSLVMDIALKTLVGLGVSK